MSEPPPSDGKYLGWLTAVKGLTLTNALVIVMLVVVAVPAYFVYRALNDEKLMNRFFSHYEEISGQQSSCTVRTAKQVGGSQFWSVSTGFAYEGADRWTLAVLLDHNPSTEDVASYCQTLILLVDFMRDPDAHSPSFPNSDNPVVRQYPRARDEQ